jgi:hypothetical protein
MFDPLIYLLYAVTGFTVFFGVVPLAVAWIRGDHQRVDKILDLYIEIFQASAAAIIGALRIFRRKDPPPSETLPPKDTKQITKQNYGDI